MGISSKSNSSWFLKSLQKRRSNILQEYNAIQRNTLQHSPGNVSIMNIFPLLLLFWWLSGSMVVMTSAQHFKSSVNLTCFFNIIEVFLVFLRWNGDLFNTPTSRVHNYKTHPLHWSTQEMIMSLKWEKNREKKSINHIDVLSFH